MEIIEKINNYLNESNLENTIKSLKKEIKFNYKIQGVNVYIKSKVDIEDFLEKLEKEMPFDIRIRYKEDKRLRAFINRGKSSGPFLFAIYFDGN